MKACNTYESLITEVISGAAGEGDRLRLENHMATCTSCAGEFANAKAVLAAAKIDHPDPGEAFWQSYFQRLNERMEVEGSESYVPERRPVGTTGDTLRQRVNRILDASAPRERWAMQLAVAVVLVVAGVLLGRTVLSPEAQQPAVVNSDTDVVQAALELRARAYLDRSKTLLLGLVNFDTDEDDPSTLNFDRRQSMAGDLVQEASFLQDRLSVTDNQQLHQLISDLEMILLQIANIESAYDVPEIEIVQSGVDRKAILFKIEVEEMRRNEAVQSDSRDATAPSSV